LDWASPGWWRGWFVLLLIAAFVRRPRYHASLAVLFMIYNILLLGTSLITDQSAKGASLLAPN
jgi:hypothetical protein